MIALAGSHAIRMVQSERSDAGDESHQGLISELGYPLCWAKVYSPRYRSAWLKKLTEAGVQCRAKWLYRQLDDLQPLRRQARHELLAESRRHPAHTLLRQVPWLGPVRVALLIALIQTPYRFRTKRTTLGVQRAGSRRLESAGNIA